MDTAVDQEPPDETVDLKKSSPIKLFKRSIQAVTEVATANAATAVKTRVIASNTALQKTYAVQTVGKEAMAVKAATAVALVMSQFIIQT
jgi:hypothetical protein